jgi:hypothetical protein
MNYNLDYREKIKLTKKVCICYIFGTVWKSYIICVMTKEQLIKLVGSQSELAKLLGISQPAVSVWKKIPQARIWQLMVLRPEWFKGQE